jgi:WD40 repeat protein
MSIHSSFWTGGIKSGVTCMSFTPDGLSLVLAESGDIHVYDTKTCNLRTSIECDCIVRYLAVTKNSQRVFYSGIKCVRTWMLNDPDSELCFRTGNFVSGLALTRDDLYIICSLQNMVQVRRVSDNTLLHQMQTAGLVRGIALSPDSRLILSWTHCTDLIKQHLQLWNLMKGISHSSLLHQDASIKEAVFFPDSEFVAAGCSDGLVVIFCVASGVVVNTLTPGMDEPFHVRDIAISSDSKFLVCCSLSNTVSLFGLTKTQGRLLISRTFHSSLNCVAFNPNSVHFAVAGYNHPVAIWIAPEWHDRIHFHFQSGFKNLVFTLMCVKHRIDASYQVTDQSFPCLPMAVWLNIFLHLHYCCCPADLLNEY